MRSTPYKILQLSEIPKDQIFEVPAQYFEQFADRVFAKPVLGLCEEMKQVTFGVPSGYFDVLSQNINKRIGLLQSLEVGLPIGSPFMVPDQYFENQQQGLAYQMLPLDEETLSPLSVPDDYFETLSTKIHERIEDGPHGKVVVIYPKLLRYAAAASVVLFMALGAYLYQNGSAVVSDVAQKPTVDLAQSMIASLSKEEVKVYLEQQDVESHDLLEYTSFHKKEKIHAAFEKEMLPVKIKKQEQEDLELELEHIDLSEITSDM